MENEVQQRRKENFSYSKLSTYEGCGWKYKLEYIDKHFVDTSSIANEFGTLVHFVEENIAKDIVANDNEPNFMIDDNKYIDIFINGSFDESGKRVLGIKELKQKYPNDFYVADKSGMDYNEKANDYLNYGIYRLRDFLAKNRNIHVVGIEQPFSIEYRGYIFKGYIDRVLKNIDTGELIIEDIKTWWTINGHDVVTPLQFVFYTLAAQELYNIENPDMVISCSYDLPLDKNRYPAGTKGYMKRGIKKIDKLLDKIENKEFEPNPTPLCHWCVFSKTYPNQPEDAKHLCPYYCNWTKEHKDFSRDFEWMGIENHDAIMSEFLKQESKCIKANVNNKNFDVYAHPVNQNKIFSDRIFIIRR